MPYDTGDYSTYLLEDYETEMDLIVKLRNRQLENIQVMARHVVSQIVPDWNQNQDDDEAVLRSAIEQCFVMSRDCTLSNDFIYYRIFSQKRLEVQVQGLSNLSEPGIHN